jgi:hypothetical protein
MTPKKPAVKKAASNTSKVKHPPVKGGQVKISHAAPS